MDRFLLLRLHLRLQDRLRDYLQGCLQDSQRLLQLEASLHEILHLDIPQDYFVPFDLIIYSAYSERIIQSLTNNMVQWNMIKEFLFQSDVRIQEQYCHWEIKC